MIQSNDIKDFYLNNPHLKKTNVAINWTKEQLTEYIKCKQDVVYFIENYVKIIHVDRGLIPFDLYPFQKRMARSFVDNRFSIVKTSRQVGKTQTVASVLLWYVLFHANYTIAVLANKLTQSLEILNRIQTSYENIPLWMQQGVIKFNAGTIELENGSRIIASSTSSSAIRGMAINILYIDEMAFIPMHLQNDFFASTYPTIISGQTTKIIITSTPKGLNLFYKLWKDATEQKNQFVPIECHWSEVPGRDEKWKKETISTIGQRRWDEEFAAEFLGSSSTLINGNKLMNMASQSPIKHNEDTVIFYDPKPNRIYTTVVDVARGLDQDYSVFTIIDVTELPYQVVARYRNNVVNPMMFPSFIYQMSKHYNEAMILVEINDIGGQIADHLHYELEYENIFLTKNRGRKQVVGEGGQTIQLGVRTTGEVKSKGCLNLKSLIEDDKLIINDEEILQELYQFTQQGNTWKAESGAHDDLVMTLVLFGWLVNQDHFKNWTDVNIREKMLAEKQKSIEDSLLSFGIVYDHNYVVGTVETVSAKRFDSWLISDEEIAEENFDYDEWVKYKRGSQDD